jgi:hypothetical protein
MANAGDHDPAVALPLNRRQAVTLAGNVAWLVGGIGALTAVVAFITGAGLGIAAVVFGSAAVLGLGFGWAGREIARWHRRGAHALLVLTLLLTFLTIGDWFLVIPLIGAVLSAVKGWQWLRATRHE